MSTIRERERSAVIQSLRAGVVPRSGQYLIQVGRARELASLIADIDRITNGGTGFRVVVGEYGAGKTFFLNLVRSIALEKRLVTVQADLNPDRRLFATGGQARALYAELMKNMSTRTKPDGGGLSGVVEKFISQAKSDAKTLGRNADEVIQERLQSLTELVNGYDFATVIAAYCRGADEGDHHLLTSALRWLRGEFTTRTDARAALGVRSFIDDSDVYDQLKLMAAFVQLAGYSGLYVLLDELVNIYKMANTQARNSNYEQILRILNDALQGGVQGMGVLIAGTPEFLMDTRRGMYSYAALQSRLAENRFARDGLVDLTGPVLRLTSLTPEDLYVLLHKIRHVYAYGNTEKYLLPDEAIAGFMETSANRLGESFFRTPRTTITAFIGLLAVLEQNPNADWRSLLGIIEIERDTGGVSDLQVDPDDNLANFRL